MNIIIKGNILNIKQGAICHQVNCRGVAGSGLAKQIANKYPNWQMEYKSSCYNISLGSTTKHIVNSTLYIVNIFSQDGYGKNRRHTNYAALGHALTYIKWNYPKWINDGLTGKIYIPYGIGCGLGGGNWDIVSEIIYDALPEAILVKLEK